MLSNTAVLLTLRFTGAKYDDKDEKTKAFTGL